MKRSVKKSNSTMKVSSGDSRGDAGSGNSSHLSFEFKQGDGMFLETTNTIQDWLDPPSHLLHR